jgi:hypothetical protein
MSYSRRWGEIMRLVTITGLDANALLYALDHHCAVDMEGKLTYIMHGYTLEYLQDLRDRLFAAHEHPEEND